MSDERRNPADPISHHGEHLSESSGIDSSTSHDAQDEQWLDDDDLIIPVTEAEESTSSEVSDGHRKRRHHDGRRRRTSQNRATRRRKRRIRAALLILCAALVCYIAYMCVSALIVKREVSAAVSVANALPQQIQASFADSSAKGEVTASLDAMSDHISAIQDQVGSPGWAIWEWIPYYGHDVQAARDTVRILDDIGDNALPQIRNALSTMDYAQFGISDGVVQLPGLANAAVQLDMADSIIANANTEFQLVENPHISQLNEAVSSAKSRVNELAQAVDVITRFSKVAPSMVDADGSQPQTYLILAENNAELRATGGLPGAWGVLTASGGTLTLSDFVPDTSITIQDQPAITLTSEEQNLYGDIMGRIPHDVNVTPDFPRAAQAAQALWEATYPDRPVNGVIALDPVFLQNLLQVTGGVTLEDGRILDGTNTVQTLLHDVYFESDDANWQNEFFTSAARSAFEQITHTSNTNLMQLIRQAASSVENGHLMVWHESTSIQKELNGTTIAGALGNSEALPEVGVYFNDAGQSKMDWYLDRDVTAALQRTKDDGSKLYDVDIELSNTVQAQDVSSLPAYVSGDGVDGLQPGEIAINLYLYAPKRGRLVDWTFPDGSGFDLLTTHNGLTVGAKRIVLQPGQSISINATVQTATAPVQSDLHIRQTPLLTK